MAEHRYDPQEIEPRWQAVWAAERTWEVVNGEGADGAPASYVLEMLPYPSGEPHIGHLKTYSVGDAIAHFHRRTGRRVKTIRVDNGPVFAVALDREGTVVAATPRITKEY